MFIFISKYPSFVIILSVKNSIMSFIDQRAKRMTTKLVKEHIKLYMMESINDKNSPNRYELEKSCLTDIKISDIQRLFDIKENDYRLLITFMFENDSFVNEISAAQEYYHPSHTQDILPSKRQIFPFSSSSNNKQSSSSNIKKGKLKIDRNVAPRYKCFEKLL